MKNNHTRLARSILIPITFILMLTGVTVAYSGYNHYRGQSANLSYNNVTSSSTSLMLPSQSSFQTTPPSSQDHLKELTLRVSHLQTQADRLEKWGKQLVNKNQIIDSDFSISWDTIITERQRATKAPISLGVSTLASRRFSRQSSIDEVKRFIKIVSEDFLRKYRSSHTNILPDGWPLKQGRVTSKFGKRGKRMHKGIDIAVHNGTSILAVEGGTVVRSKYMRGYGRIVEIQHSSMYSTRYAHNSNNFVSVGDIVDKGQIIASVGSTGRSTGPHVHFEVRQSGVAINPIKYLGAMDTFTLSENIKLSEYVRLSK
ncbi:M23 family metallopeptidase [Candidatus Parabeggiatoa sp. HSG14]